MLNKGNFFGCPVTLSQVTFCVLLLNIRVCIQINELVDVSCYVTNFTAILNSCYF